MKYEFTIPPLHPSVCAQSRKDDEVLLMDMGEGFKPAVKMRHR